MKEKSFKSKCLENNVNYGYANYYRQKYRELTDEQIIEYCLTRPKKRKHSNQNVIELV